jgi:hypothetical protein
MGRGPQSSYISLSIRWGGGALPLKFLDIYGYIELSLKLPPNI